MAIACALGGPDRRTLFLLSAQEHAAEALAGTHEGRIDVVQVPVAGVGIP
jgi:sugar lactone lactonase YvrE